MAEGLLTGSIRNIISVPDLRTRILFMFGLLAVYRMGSWIPTPGVDTLALQQLFDQQAGTIFGFLDVFSGGNLRRLSIFALGIMPYITASIILQLLTVVWPYLERLSKEGQLGRKKITQYTRYLTVVLSLFQGFATSLALAQDRLRSPHCAQSRLGLHLNDHADFDYRDRLCHVAWGTDFRTGYWERDFADYIRRHSGGPGSGGNFPGPGAASSLGNG